MTAKARDVKKVYKQFAAELQAQINEGCDRARDLTPNVKVVTIPLLKLYIADAIDAGYRAGFRDRGFQR